MPLPIVLVVGGIGVGAYLLGRFRRREREHDLENQLNISDAIHSKKTNELRDELKKTRKEILEDLMHDDG